MDMFCLIALCAILVVNVVSMVKLWSWSGTETYYPFSLVWLSGAIISATTILPFTWAIYNVAKGML